ncbi:MAG TPA: hypothetical protein VNY51_14695 [Candidatus Dormibacteraeota bacterium]|jgi:hypothetical protein|nr:hypothetical protein [Candidatus Dormibacteraeota bacterium]
MQKVLMSMLVVIAVCGVVFGQVDDPKSAVNNASSWFDDAGSHGLKLISGNLSEDPFARYFPLSGLAVSGPNSVFPDSAEVAVAFTPRANVTIDALLAAVQWGQGKNEVVLSLAQDSNDSPGTIIASFPVANLPGNETCCRVAVADHVGVAVMAGTKYWMIATTDSSDADFFGQWCLNTRDMRPHEIAQNYDNTGWIVENYVQPAYAVLGR